MVPSAQGSRCLGSTMSPPPRKSWSASTSAVKLGGNVTPSTAWVWSEEPTHEPLVSRETLEAAGQVSQRARIANDVLRGGSTLIRSHPFRAGSWCSVQRKHLRNEQKPWQLGLKRSELHLCNFVEATKHYLNRYPLLQELLSKRAS